MKRTKKEKIPRELANRISRISGYSLVLVVISWCSASER
jgi:hypothetical protein